MLLGENEQRFRPSIWFGLAVAVGAMWYPLSALARVLQTGVTRLDALVGISVICAPFLYIVYFCVRASQAKQSIGKIIGWSVLQFILIAISACLVTTVLTSVTGQDWSHLGGPYRAAKR